MTLIKIKFKKNHKTHYLLIIYFNLKNLTCFTVAELISPLVKTMKNPSLVGSAKENQLFSFVKAITDKITSFPEEFVPDTIIPVNEAVKATEVQLVDEIIYLAQTLE